MDDTMMFIIYVGALGLGLFIAGCVGLAMSKKPGPIGESDVEAAYLLANSGVTDEDWDDDFMFCGCVV